MDQFFDIVLKIVYLAGAAFIVYLLPKVKAFIETKLDVEDAEKLEQLVTTFVLAAEQTMNVDGTEKKAYVEKQLEELGIQLTDYIEALIEKAVFVSVNGSEKEVEVKKALKKVAKKASK